MHPASGVAIAERNSRQRRLAARKCSAILRSARAAGVDLVLLAPGTVDAFNDKVVRAAMGAHFSVSIRAEPWEKIAQRVRDALCAPRVYLADARGEVAYTRARIGASQSR
jgi:hypothetical protein